VVYYSSGLKYLHRLPEGNFSAVLLVSGLCQVVYEEYKKGTDFRITGTIDTITP